MSEPLGQVPRGPGVQPPFLAPPTEGRSARRWLAAGIAAGLLALCCGTGGVAVGGLLFTMIPALNEQAQAAVGDYLDALADQRWQRAYQLRCEADQEVESLESFTDRVSQPPHVQSYELGDLNLLTGGGQDGQLRLPAQVRYTDGTTELETYLLAQNQRTGTLQVCQRAE